MICVVREGNVEVRRERERGGVCGGGWGRVRGVPNCERTAEPYFDKLTLSMRRARSADTLGNTLAMDRSPITVTMKSKLFQLSLGAGEGARGRR